MYEMKADMKKRNEERRLKRIWHFTGGTVLLLLAAILSLMARRAEGFAQWYSEHIYRILTETVGRAAGILPFSAAEVLLYILILWLIFSTVKIIWKQLRRTGAGLVDFAGKVFAVVGMLAFLYTACCGINYYRTSFAESAGLEMDGYTTSQLASVCVELTDELNRKAETVERDADGVMICGDDISLSAPAIMKHAAEAYPQLQGYYPRAKELLNPWILSVQKVTGIYSPFTIEANINGDITDYNIPFTACHELSHLRGYMQEEEANFIAWLACRESDRAEFQYSGSLRGWIGCMNVLYRADYELWAAIRVTLNPAVEADIAANRDYWAKFESPVADAAQTVNDTYLKVNGQSDGIQSYGRMADLIVSWYLMGYADREGGM